MHDGWSSVEGIDVGPVLQSLTLSTQLYRGAHAHAIKTVAFPHDYSEVFLTAGKGEIRVWDHNKRETLTRISVPSSTCQSLAVTQVCGPHVTAPGGGVRHHPKP